MANPGTEALRVPPHHQGRQQQQQSPRPENQKQPKDIPVVFPFRLILVGKTREHLLSLHDLVDPGWAFAPAPDGEDGFPIPELLRLKGELHIARNPITAAFRGGQFNDAALQLLPADEDQLLPPGVLLRFGRLHRTVERETQKACDKQQKKHQSQEDGFPAGNLVLVGVPAGAAQIPQMLGLSVHQSHKGVQVKGIMVQEDHVPVTVEPQIVLVVPADAGEVVVAEAVGPSEERVMGEAPVVKADPAVGVGQLHGPSYQTQERKHDPGVILPPQQQGRGDHKDIAQKPHPEEEVWQIDGVAPGRGPPDPYGPQAAKHQDQGDQRRDKGQKSPGRWIHAYPHPFRPLLYEGGRRLSRPGKAEKTGRILSSRPLLFWGFRV